MRRAGLVGSLRHPILFTLVALALGPVYSWSIVSSVWRLPWTRGWAIYFFPTDPARSVIPFALASVSTAWLFRKRIAAASAWWDTASPALWCALLGGPLFVFFQMILSLFLVPEQVEGIKGVFLALFLLPIGSALFGGIFGALLLPVSLPLSWCSIQVLRLASGGLRRAQTTA